MEELVWLVEINEVFIVLRSEIFISANFWLVAPPQSIFPLKISSNDCDWYVQKFILKKLGHESQGAKIFFCVLISTSNDEATHVNSHVYT